MADFTRSNLWKLLRMWGIVFLANTFGTFLASLFYSYTPVISADLREGMLAISSQMMNQTWLGTVCKGIAAGFLIAAMVWLIPSAEAAQFHVITLMTYLIAVGGLMHVVAGSMEAFLLLLHGDLTAWRMIADFFVPVFIGNVVGGTALFALISYAQVMHEI
ncbi:MAG: formate/nitrite transporter family protein [Methylobacteriaceae bacterium]|nr:formate/nitrite transporter family protein [Methylobacteriaceae bacterium]